MVTTDWSASSRTELRADVMGGDLYLFVNGKRTGCKGLLWDGTIAAQLPRAAIVQVIEMIYVSGLTI